MADLVDRHGDRFVMIVRMRVIQQSETDRLLIDQCNIITVNRTGVGPGVNLGIDVGKTEFRE